MNSLEVAISQVDDVSDASSVLTALTTASVKRVVYHGYQTLAAYTQAYGQPATGMLLATLDGAVTQMKASGDPTAIGTALLIEKFGDRFAIGGGLMLDDDQVRADLDTLAPILTDQLAKLKALGATYHTPLEIAGADVPTLDQVEATCVIVRKKRRSTRWVQQVNEQIFGNNGNGYSVEELQAQVAAFAGVY